MASELATLADALAKFPKLLEMLYVDLAQPGVKQVGIALETIVGLGNTAMWPIALLNSRSKAALDANMERYRRKMEAIPPEQVVHVAPEIGVPIAEKLTYVGDEQLAELYTQLLASASNQAKVGNAHPSFVHVINNLCPDEATLLSLLRVTQHIPIVRVAAVSMGPGTQYEWGLHAPTTHVKGLTYPENFRSYLSNLTGLGLIEIDLDRWLSTPGLYEPLETAVMADYQETIREFKATNDDPAKGLVHQLKLDKGFVRATPYGTQFFRACMP